MIKPPNNIFLSTWSSDEVVYVFLFCFPFPPLGFYLYPETMRESQPPPALICSHSWLPLPLGPWSQLTDVKPHLSKSDSAAEWPGIPASLGTHTPEEPVATRIVCVNTPCQPTFTHCQSLLHQCSGFWSVDPRPAKSPNSFFVVVLFLASSVSGNSCLRILFLDLTAINDNADIGNLCLVKTC